MFSPSASKKIFLNFIIKLLLILVIIISGITLIFSHKDSNSYQQLRIDRIARLNELGNSLQRANHFYQQYINGPSTAQLDSLNASLKAINEYRSSLLVFKQENDLYKKEIIALENRLDDEERYYRQQVQSFSGQQDGTTTAVQKNNPEMGSAQLLVATLIKLETEDLKDKTVQIASSLVLLGYIIVIVGSIVFALNILFYYVSQKHTEKQAARDRELYNAKLAAQSANNAKSEYLAMISHEIRTPMNGVLGMSNLLLQGSLSTEQQEYAKTIHDSANSLLRIVNDILDFSKIEAGKLNLDHSSVNVRSLVDDVFAILPRHNVRVKLSYHIDKNVPSFIHSDLTRLRQILLNFLGNAIKFTDQGSVELECKLIDKTQNGDMKLGFVIRDTGIGIAEDKIKQLFKPFVQVGQSTTRKYGGTGLGLNIAYNLINMMNGKVKVKSELRRGSTFTFYILTQEAPESLITPAPKERVQKVLDNELSTNYPFKILVVDDNEINLMLITKTLSKLGYECKKASNGQMAVDMVKQEQFDLIFMDMQMPVMDGTVATTEIRKFYRVYEYPVVVALTANALGDGKDKCLEAGMQDFIAKPFKPAEIEEVIKKWAPRIIEYRTKHQSSFVS